MFIREYQKQESADIIVDLADIISIQAKKFIWYNRYTSDLKQYLLREHIPYQSKYSSQKPKHPQRLEE